MRGAQERVVHPYCGMAPLNMKSTVGRSISLQVDDGRKGQSLTSMKMEGMDEPSLSMGAPDVHEPPVIGAQYLTRYNIWKNFVRATRPALVRASPKTNKRVKLSSKVVAPHLRKSLVRNLCAKTCNPLQ